MDVKEQLIAVSKFFNSQNVNVFVNEDNKVCFLITKFSADNET